MRDFFIPKIMIKFEWYSEKCKYVQNMHNISWPAKLKLLSARQAVPVRVHMTFFLLKSKYEYIVTYLEIVSKI